ncbi:S1C family serine protease [Paenibacillus alginolyticus]|uniref:Trypsin-like peptidase domain-containing protein n=1 Tax=Paenibacillus alginolyticus TaxID=59839 RepID=A0ABT4GAA1_9BACL|nr:trypsin-like peptidase domain-containing protein [Paenibacillus alginolyticus]MCY9693112.1 trypsin-like peptidase domain-containing protein [Paenibacillus alginolyticus]MEC0147199.1 trypsin-like peptidase domain-containing protein [Paenibacillus alginolyticus]
MSLFDDDFYSTKRSKQRQDTWRPKGTGAFTSFAGRRRNVALIAGVGGALAMLLLVGLVAGFGKSNTSGAPLAIPASVAKAEAHPMNSNDSVVAATEKIKPAVVSVISSKKDDKGQETGLGIGSGVIFARNGDKVRIVTNSHVVESGNQFEIVNFQGEHRKATLIGRDRITDLALLEADGKDIKVLAEFGDSESLRAGEMAIAVGNPLGLGFSPTVTQGIISSPKRTIPVSLAREGTDYDWEMDVIQTDAAINQGNSGGPLVNIEGKVIGINSMKISDTGVEGLGFAIPINSVKPIMESLIKDHKVKRPLMGVSTQELQAFKGTDVLKLPADVKTGVIVFDVSGPAKEAGLKAQDVIVQLDDRKIDSTISLRKYLYNEKKIGDKVNVVYYRGGKKLNAVVTLVEAMDK